MSAKCLLCFCLCIAWPVWGFTELRFFANCEFNCALLSKGFMVITDFLSTTSGMPLVWSNVGWLYDAPTARSRLLFTFRWGHFLLTYHLWLSRYYDGARRNYPFLIILNLISCLHMFTEQLNPIKKSKPSLGLPQLPQLCKRNYKFSKQMSLC